MAVPWWNECTNRKAPRCDWSYGLTGSSIEIQGGPLASVRAAITTARIRVCMATSRYGLPVGCRSAEEGLGPRYFASSEIFPLKLRTVTWAPPGPVEARNAPRSLTSAVMPDVL